MYRVLTELTVITHLLFVVFVVFGGFVARRSGWLTIAHISSVAWAVYAELASGVVCPLTALENYFAERAGVVNYEEDFITRYLVPVIYQDGIGPILQYLLVGLVFAVNVVAYTRRRNQTA